MLINNTYTTRLKTKYNKRRLGNHIHHTNDTKINMYLWPMNTEGHSFKTLRFFQVIRLCFHRFTFMLMTWKISSIFSTVTARIYTTAMALFNYYVFANFRCGCLHRNTVLCNLVLKRFFLPVKIYD